MRIRWKYWAILFMVVVLIIGFLLMRKPAAMTNAVVVTLTGYTNLPGNSTRSAIFSASNQAPYAVQWYVNWVEVEGISERKASVINFNLPGFPRRPELKAGGWVRIAVGEPFYGDETG